MQYLKHLVRNTSQNQCSFKCLRKPDDVKPSTIPCNAEDTLSKNNCARILAFHVKGSSRMNQDEAGDMPECGGFPS